MGRWWRDEAAEIDVLALVDDVPVLAGECRWQTREVSERDLAELRAELRHLPAGPARADLLYAFWSRGGPTADLARHPDARAYTAADLLGEA